MRRARAFTLIELLAVISIIVILMAILMPTIAAIQEQARRASCQHNLGNIGRACITYATAYNERFPYLNGQNWLNNTGTDRDNDDHSQQSFTSLMFLLVREGQDPKLFACPSDPNVNRSGEPHPRKTTGTQFAWDFTSAAYVSYSYQAPLKEGTAWTNGVGQEDNLLVIMADRPPPWPGNWVWTTSTSGTAKKYNSTNHDGDINNILTKNGAAMPKKTPNCGLPSINLGQGDCIYTVNNSATVTPLGKAWSDSMDLNSHVAAQDTFLPFIK